MKKAFILVGISGSGKSTEVVQIQKDHLEDLAELNRDNIRIDILRQKGFDVDKENIWKFWNFKWEDEVTKRWNQRFNLLTDANMGIIFSDTNLDRRKSSDLAASLRMIGYDVEFKVIETPVEECIKRDIKRKNTVGPDIIYKQYAKFVANGWSHRPRYEPNLSNIKAILVDIDGTLAHMDGKRGPFEWDKVHLDRVDEEVRFIVNSFIACVDTKIIILSGRDGSSYDATKEWLKDHKIYHDYLLMRAAGDMRKDSIIKEEIFWRDIAPIYNVRFVIDDRPQVCRMWRDLGLKVMQVADPHLEF